MHRLFISDLHLDASRPSITQAFLRFVDEQAKAADELYILGDFFESWIGDDDSNALIETIRAALLSLTERSSPTAVYFMPGNRDFLLGETFCQSCGVTLLSDPFSLNLNGTHTLLMHGDSLCTDDSEYMQFRALLRSPAWQADVLNKPLEERRALAQQLRMASKDANSNKAADIMDVNQEEVLRVLENAQAPLMIHGHTHRPARHQLQTQFGSAERIVLGDWEAQAKFLRSQDHTLQLETWPIN